MLLLLQSPSSLRDRWPQSRIAYLLSSVPVTACFMVKSFLGSQVRPAPVSPACQTLGRASRASLRLAEAALKIIKLRLCPQKSLQSKSSGKGRRKSVQRKHESTTILWPRRRQGKGRSRCRTLYRNFSMTCSIYFSRSGTIFGCLGVEETSWRLA